MSTSSFTKLCLTLGLVLTCLGCKHRRSSAHLQDAVVADMRSNVRFSDQPLTFAQSLEFCREDRMLTAEELLTVASAQAANNLFWIVDNLKIEKNRRWYQVSSYRPENKELGILHLTLQGEQKMIAACIKGRRDEMQRLQMEIYQSMLKPNTHKASKSMP